MSSDCSPGVGSAASVSFEESAIHSVGAQVTTPVTSSERGLEFSISTARASCWANVVTSLEEHLSKGGLHLNLLKYFALNNANFRLLLPDSI